MPGSELEKKKSHAYVNAYVARARARARAFYHAPRKFYYRAYRENCIKYLQKCETVIAIAQREEKERVDGGRMESVNNVNKISPRFGERRRAPWT